MIYWALLLHFYQPPTQVHFILNKVSEESYRPLIKVFQNNPDARASVNVNAVLTEMFAEHGKKDIIKGLAELAEKQQIEFTGSARYHPILPLIPADEVMKQIIDNNRINRSLFGPSYQPRGFFPPEMCYSRSIVDPILNTGHQWVIAGGIACPVPWPLDTVHYVNTSKGKLFTFFRDDVLSNRVSFKEIDVPGFIKHLTVFAGDKKNIYVVTAMDAETFGHHIKDWEKDFLDVLYRLLAADPPHKNNPETGPAGDTGNTIKPVTISELLDLFKSGNAIQPRSSSWSTTADDLKAANPYPLWNAPDNTIHKLLWEHLNLTIGMTDRAVSAADNDASRQSADIARELLDPALHSDQFWWASKRPHWDINMINRGLELQQECLLNAYHAINDCAGLSATEKNTYRYQRLAAENIAGHIRELLAEEP